MYSVLRTEYSALGAKCSPPNAKAVLAKYPQPYFHGPTCSYRPLIFPSAYGQLMGFVRCKYGRRLCLPHWMSTMQAPCLVIEVDMFLSLELFTVLSHTFHILMSFQIVLIVIKRNLGVRLDLSVFLIHYRDRNIIDTGF